MKKKELKVKEIPYQYSPVVIDYQDFTVQSTPEIERLELHVGNIWSNKVQCKDCGWYIRSKHRHHYIKCKCGNIAIDGGSWYQRILSDVSSKGYINYIEYYDDAKKEKVHNKRLRKEKGI